MYKYSDEILYGNIKIHCSNVHINTVFSRKVAFCVHVTFTPIQKASNQLLPLFRYRTIKHRHSGFQSYLSFHKMRDVPGFFLTQWVTYGKDHVGGERTTNLVCLAILSNYCP